MLAAAARCSEPGRASERAGASAYHLRTFSIAAMTLLISSLARLLVSARTDLPDMVLAGREREERERGWGSAPAGSCSRHSPALSLAHRHTLTHIRAHTKPGAAARPGPSAQAPGGSCTERGGAARPPVVGPPGAAALPGEPRGPRPGKRSGVTPTSQHAGVARARTSPEAAGAAGTPPPRHTPWGWQTGGRRCPGLGLVAAGAIVQVSCRALDF